MQILFEDEYFFAIEKPAGFFVHPPELSPYPVPKNKICVNVLRKSMRQEVFPVHRLDAPTSGVLLFAKSRQATRVLCQLFMDRKMHKTYLAVVRGWVDPSGKIEIPLEIDDQGQTADAVTEFAKLNHIELPFAVGKKYSSSRYALVRVHPVTGRWHQIRRHFDRIAHPLLGDIEHGDSHHNRFFRDQLNIRGLCLKAQAIEFQHPWTREYIKIESPECEKWSRIHTLFTSPHTILSEFSAASSKATP